MANPFGSADETLTKNTGHTNQANLIFAMIPRAANKWREVVTAVDVTPGSSGSYDADGYWRASGTSFVDVLLTIAKSAGNAFTVIASSRYNSGGGGGGNACRFGMLDVAGNSRFCIRHDVYSRQASGQIRDGSGTSTGVESSYYDPGVDTFSFAAKNNGSTAQAGLYRVSGTTTAAGTGNTAMSTSDNALTRLGAQTTNKWACQYVFVYDASLSDADIEAIIDSPGGVISQGGTANQVVKVERGRTLARGLGRGIF
jgi:hypothetical protein